MYRCDFIAPEKRIRHTAETRPVRYCAIESDAGNAEARAHESAKLGKTLRQAGDSISPIDRSVTESESNGTRCRSCAKRARGTDQSARCCARRDPQLRRRARETDA